LLCFFVLIRDYKTSKWLIEKCFSSFFLNSTNTCPPSSDTQGWFRLLHRRCSERNHSWVSEDACPLFDSSLKGKDFLDFLNAYTTLNKGIFSKYACSVRKLWQLRSVVDIIIFIKQISWFMRLLFHRYVWPHYLFVAVPNIIYYIF